MPAPARELSERLLAVAEGEHDTGRLLEAHHARWATLCSAGEATAALPHVDRGRALYDPVRHRSQTFLYGGHDPGACAQYHLAQVQWLLGYPDRALVALREATSLAKRLAHPLTMTIMLSITSWVLYQRGDRAAARDRAQQLVALAEAQGFVAWVDDGLAVLACVEVQDSTEEARLSEVYRRLTTSRARAAWRNVIALCLVAEGYGKIGEAGKGLEALGAILEDHRGILCAPEIQRLRGHLLLGRGESVEAEGCLRRAIELAHRRDEKSFELRASTSLARLLDGQGKRDEAPRAGGRERVKLLKLLWDALGSEFASRHVQYEMFYAGEPAAIQGREFRSFDWAAAEALVDHCLASYDVATV